METSNPELSLRIASATNVSTSVEHLVQLSKDQSYEVRKAVSGNPNTPVEVLLKLGDEFPDEIVANPIFKILLLEDAESRFVRLSLARSSTISEAALIQLSDIVDEEILCAIAKNPITPISILEKFVHYPPQFYEDPESSDYDQLFASVAKNPNVSVELLTKLSERGGNVCYAIAENPKTPQTFLEQYAAWRNFDMHRALMRNPNLPACALEILAGGLWPNINVKQCQVDVRTHPNVSETAIYIANFIDGKPGTPQYVLEKLASDHRPEVRRLVAEHPNASSTALEKLIQDRDKSVRQLVACHPHLSSSGLEKITHNLFTDYLEEIKYDSVNLRDWESTFLGIMKHPNVTSDVVEIFTPLVRLRDHNHKNYQRVIVDAVLEHEKLSQSTIINFIQDPECVLLIYSFTTLFNNPNLTTEILEIFIQGLLNPGQFNVLDSMPDYVIRSKALAESLAQQFESKANNTLAKYVDHPNISPQRLEQLSTHPFALVRRGVAKNPNTPISALQMLATHPTLGDRYAVAQNPNAPANLLLRLAVDREESVRGEVAKNTKTPLVILETLADDESPYVRSALAKNPSVSNTILSRLASDPIQDVRRGVLDNPNTPAQILDLFINDPNYQIQVKLVQHPNTSVQRLLKLAEEPESQFRGLLFAKGDDLPAVVLERLMTSTLAHIQAKDNQKCDSDKEDVIMDRIAKHPNTPVHILEQFATNKPVELYERFGEFWFNFLRRAVASNISTPDHILEKLVNDPQLGENGAREAAQKNLRNR